MSKIFSLFIILHIIYLVMVTYHYYSLQLIIAILRILNRERYRSIEEEPHIKLTIIWREHTHTYICIHIIICSLTCSMSGMKDSISRIWADSSINTLSYCTNHTAIMVAILNITDIIYSMLDYSMYLESKFYEVLSLESSMCACHGNNFSLFN